MQPIFFKTPEALRTWFERNHSTASELWAGFYKKAAGKGGITWSEAVDEALCFGWIDGIRKRVDEVSYTNRFTPRKRGSNWSDVNVRKVKELSRAGRMTPAGMKAFQDRDRAKQGVYSYERRNAALTASQTRRFRASKEAWAFFSQQAPSYKKVAIHWVTSAKREETKERRLQRLIDESAVGRRVGW